MFVHTLLQSWLRAHHGVGRDVFSHPEIQLASPGDAELVPLGVGEEIAAARNGLPAGTASPFAGLWH